MTLALSAAIITAENTFSDWVFPIKGKFNFSLSGSWTATVHFQRSFDKGVTPLDVEEFTSNMEKFGENPEEICYRFGVKTGNFTSGSIVGRISQ
jgi:hypothetical protein